jgi:uncharacterized protein (TIGR02996 family)
MNDRDALYAAILAHPDEDTPRLAYADWLEEHGDADHAAFIRKQIELSKVPEWDELAIHERYQPTVKGEAFEIEWLKRECPTPFRWASQFRRGFANSANAQLWRADGASWAGRLAALCQIAPIDELIVTDKGDIPCWNEFLQNTCLTQIHCLKLEGAALTADQVRQLISCPHMTGLCELGVTLDSAETAAALFRSRLGKQLTHLEPGIVEADEKTAAALKSLVEDSELRSLRVDTDQLWTALCSSTLGRLEELKHDAYDRSHLDLEPFVRSLRGDQLRSLELRGTLKDRDVRALAECSALSGLRRLVLDSCKLTPRAIQILAKSPYLNNLLTLNLSKNPIGDSGIAAIVQSTSLENLIVLECDGCDLTDKAGDTILNSRLVKTLVHLHFNEPGGGFTPGMVRKLRRIKAFSGG